MVGKDLTNHQEQYRVLIVEDNVELLDVLIRAITRIGQFQVIGAKDGISGLEQCAEFHPHCMVIDVKMPGLDGYQLVRALRGDPQTASIPLIILTALTQDKEKFVGLASGADLYLTKPITPQALATAIHDVIRISEEERLQQFTQLAEEPPESVQ
jgi:DNA-binding response OmpR family regulator